MMYPFEGINVATGMPPASICISDMDRLRLSCFKLDTTPQMYVVFMGSWLFFMLPTFIRHPNLALRLTPGRVVHVPSLT